MCSSRSSFQLRTRLTNLPRSWKNFCRPCCRRCRLHRKRYPNEKNHLRPNLLLRHRSQSRHHCLLQKLLSQRRNRRSSVYHLSSRIQARWSSSPIKLSSSRSFIHRRPNHFFEIQTSEPFTTSSPASQSSSSSTWLWKTRLNRNHRRHR